ncbi:SCUBE3 [Symbiodinium microadriaticum]|nr:SCUBE3 [Symbiodinium microadriaticum]
MAVEFNLQMVASLINYRKGNALGKFAGVIFTRQDSPFQTFDDLRTANVEAVSISGLGAMQLQQAELLSQGLNIMTDVPRLTFAFNQNKIVQDVELGLADVGFVRTDLIDRNVANNLTKWEYFRVIGQIPDSDFPFARSTAFTPEWPIGALPHVTDEVKELVASSLMALDRFSPDPELSEPAIAGMTGDKPHRELFVGDGAEEAIKCPAGFVKKARDKVFCEDCRTGYSCLCSPCAKLRDPEYVLKASLSSTAWMGNVDVGQVNNETIVASSCERMSVCGQVFTGQKLRWVLLDQIGTASRLAINAPLVTSVSIRTSVDGPWLSTDVRNITIEDADTQEYSLEYEAQGSGTQVIQVDINGQPAALSPVVLEVRPPPLRQIDCPPGRQPDFHGVCTACAPGTASAGGGAPCRPCDPGTSQPLAEQSNCEACAVGTFQESPASLRCELCPPGYSSRGKTGSLVCSACDPGQEAPNNGSERCSLCPRGFYSEEEGSSHCVQCNGGKGTTEQGVTDPGLCICLPGEFLADASEGNVPSALGGQCVPCAEGLVCPGGNGPPLQKAGFWVDTAAHGHSAYRCRDKWQCPEGPLGWCSDGREGRACNNCKEWHRQGTQGRCKPCEGVDVLPAMLLLLATVLTGGVLLSFVHTNAARQRLGQVTVFLTAGQIILMLQLMAAMRNLDLQWTGPALYVIEFLDIFAFDVDFLNIGCVVSNDGAVLTFAMQLLAYPVFAALLMLVWVCISRLGLEVTWNDVVNMNGLALLTLYMTLTINSLLPLQCIANPNGTFSMQTQPGVICFQSDEHWALMFMCVLGILMYPVAILTVALRATIMYPSYISSGKGLLIVNRYRFLFERFRSLAFWVGASRYFYGVAPTAFRYLRNINTEGMVRTGANSTLREGNARGIEFQVSYLLRNTLLALIPVAVASFPTVQVVLLAAVLLAGMLVQIRTWPWRTQVANVTDMLFSTAVVLFLVVAGPILSSESAQDRQAYAGFLSWSFTMLLAFAFLTLFVTIALFLWRRCHPEKTFKIFLTHHKSAAGALARFIKSILNKHSHDKVFLDSDELQDLDSLFESVRSNVAFLVPLLTPQMISRPWCVGELVTAHFNRVPLLPISCDGYRLSSSVNAAQLVNAWSPDDFQPLLAVGIQEDMIDAMIEHLYALPSIALNRRGTMEDQEATILRVITSSEMKRRRFVDSASTSGGARVLIIGHTEDEEAMSASMVLQMELQRMLQERVAGPRTRAEIVKALPTADSLIVLLHKGVLYNATFAEMILEASRAALKDGDGTGSDMMMTKVPSIASSSSGGDRQGRAWTKLVTVNADTGFVYPGHEFYTVLHGQGLGVDGLGPDVGPYLVDAYKAIFKKISMPFSCSHAAEGLLLQQAKEISKRLVASMDTMLMGKTSTGRHGNSVPGSANSDLMNSISPGSVRTSRAKDAADKASPAHRPTEVTDAITDFDELGRLSSLGASDSDSEGRVGCESAGIAFELPRSEDAEQHSF